MNKIKKIWSIIISQTLLFLIKIFHKNLKYNILSIKEINSIIKIENNGKISLGRNTSLKNGSEVKSSNQLVIGDGSTIEKGTSLISTKTGKITIGKSVYINRNCTIVSCENIKIDDGTAIGYGTLILDHDHYYVKEGKQDWNKFKSKPVIIGKNVWIGANVTILAGTVIGDNCVIAAGSVIKGVIPKSKVVIQKKTSEMIDIK